MVIILAEIKGYVWVQQNQVPVTWKRETRRYVYDVRTLSDVNGRWEANERLFDDKMDKEEIVFSP